MRPPATERDCVRSSTRKWSANDGLDRLVRYRGFLGRVDVVLKSHMEPSNVGVEARGVWRQPGSTSQLEAGSEA